MTYYLVIFAAGFAGSFHCVGMCGGFACALGHRAGVRAVGARAAGAPAAGACAPVLRQLAYNSGRLATYCFLGGLAGALGQVICTSQGMQVPLLGGSLDAAQRLLAIVAGLLMIAMALQLLGLLHGLPRVANGFAGSTLVTSLRSLLAAPGAAAPLAFGVFNGFLPCPLVYAFVAQAASTASALPGLLTMAAFGLGTFPAMLMMGGLGQLVAPRWRQRGVWVAGSYILLLGLITLGRGLVPFAAHVAHFWHPGHPA